MTVISRLTEENKQLLHELGRPQEENCLLKGKLKEKTFGVAFIATKNKDSSMRSYTGLPNYKVFLWLLALVSDVLPTSAILSPGDVLLLILMKLKPSLRHTDLGQRFELSKTRVSNLINDGLPILSKRLAFSLGHGLTMDKY